ncbi:alpha/beta hydrolase (plasmid) [Agrobacterium tumefaciens]|uniref:Alpha/beta hydrolase n=1 Tax=Agrobacterium tumefaciens TaxID=358 RepID=A0AAP9J9P8_AGRTU|nr:alpha/beta hydrolase [Agrobacterium tumefaciens]NSZ60018.1 alpha/beta hydrolase [Agrobacterium tumefaciens]QDY97621.1 alpha/beta hydrolase [Agrobacterium tumefaciens]UXS12746.1 alpha/beta hydrolase [Agrobacterium tumefaciens]UXS20108.1 alpha/beta hydrolase [Agrobacterium tumefaciens]UXS27755.1 alpha/beta hydrolase [Agrobacterium tumefaciens]
MTKTRPLDGFGSVTGVPKLPEGFRDVFSSHRVDANGLGLHAVIGGKGPALLLLGGWPQNWFAWRYVMLPLSQYFTVIAVDPRGVGLSEKPSEGYDADTLSADMFALMDALGHEKFSMVGHDVGLWIGYVMAADRPDRIERIALGEAIVPGLSPSPPLLSDDRWVSDFLWHFNFNRALGVNERLVEGREDLYFGYQFDTKSGSAEKYPTYGKEFYIETLRRVPGALKASFDYYRAIDQSIPQYRRRKETMIEIPVLAFSGALACGPMVENELRTVASNVDSVIIPDCGHYPAEEQPEALLKALSNFLRPVGH